MDEPDWLVPLRTGEEGTPLFLVHPVGGSVMPYMWLAQLLDGENPVYGLEARGLHEPDLDGSLEDAASAYVAAVRLVQPKGPYFLGGWSLGGAVSFEMARQLLAEGERSTLLLLDTDPDWTLPGTPDDKDLLMSFVEDLAGQLGRGVPAVPSLEGLPAGGDQAAALVVDLVDAGLIPAMLSDEVRGRLGVFLAFARAYTRYCPEPADLRVVLFATAEGAKRQQAAWSELARLGSEVRVVEGDHYSLLQEPQVELLAGAIGAALRTVGV